MGTRRETSRSGERRSGREEKTTVKASRRAAAPTQDPKSVAAAIGNQGVQQAARRASGIRADLDQQQRTRAEDGQPLDEQTRRRFEGWFGVDLSPVRLHAGQLAAANAGAVDARATTQGENIQLGANAPSPRSGPGQQLLAHELTHVVQQRGGSQQTPTRISRPDEASEIEAREAASQFSLGEPAPPIEEHVDSTLQRNNEDEDPEAASAEAATPEAEGEEDVAEPHRRFVWSLSSVAPDIVFVPEDAPREEIARELLNDGAMTEAFYFVSPSELAGGAGPAGDRAIRFNNPKSIPDSILSQMREAFELKLTNDVNTVVATLIGGADNNTLAMIVLRWSQYSQFEDERGTSYFERFLQALDNRRIITTTDYLVTETKTERSAYEELLIATSNRPLEMIRKAITLRSDRDVGYEVEDRAPQLGGGDAVGRWFSSVDRMPIRATILYTVAEAPTLQEAQIRTRSASYLGPRVVVPGTNKTFYGYAIQFDTVPGGATPGAERGEFTWYYPGTIFIGGGDFDPMGFDLKPDTGYATFMVGEALNRVVPEDASALYGLDYGVLNLATPDERIKIFRSVLGGRSVEDPRAIELLSRTLLTIRPEDFAAFQRTLDKEGVITQLLSIRDPKIRAQLSLLGQAFTYQRLSTVPLSEQSFAESITIRFGDDADQYHYFRATSAAVTSHAISLDEWNETGGAAGAPRMLVEPALPGEPTQDIPRTGISFVVGSYPTSYAVDTSRWHRRTEGEASAAFLPTDLVTLETYHHGKVSARLVTALEAAMLQGDPESESSSRDLGDFLDTLMLMQAAFGAGKIAQIGLRALAAESFSAGLKLLTTELATQSGRAAVRSVVDYAVFSNARYVSEHEEELSRTPEGRLYLALSTSAMALLVARDIGHLVESGLITRLVAAGRNAMVRVGGAARLAIRRMLQNARAAQLAWGSMREAGALELVTEVGGFSVLRPRSLDEFAHAFRVSQAQVAGEELLATVGASGGSTTRAQAVLGRLERAAGGFTRAPGAAPRTAAEAEAANAYRDIARHATDLSPAQLDDFLQSVDRVTAIRGRSAAEMAPFLRAAVKPANAANAAEYLKNVEWLATQKISREALAVLGKKALAKAGAGTVDLAWLRTTNLSAEDLDWLARDPKTPWNLMKEWSLDPTNAALTQRLSIRLRGIAAEMEAGERVIELVPGFRIEARQVRAGSSEIDYTLISTDRLGRRRGMEVKGLTRKTWTEWLDSYRRRGRPGETLTDAELAQAASVDRMVGQLRDAAAHATGDVPVLVVSTKIKPEDLQRLRDVLEANHVRAEIVFLDEAAITQASRRLRATLRPQ